MYFKLDSDRIASFISIKLSFYFCSSYLLQMWQSGVWDCCSWTQCNGFAVGCRKSRFLGATGASQGAGPLERVQSTRHWGTGWRKCNLTHLVAWKQKICQVLFWLHVFNAEAWVCSVTFTVSLLTVFHSSLTYVFKAWLGCCYAKPQPDWGLLGALLPVPMQP
jgi:hypothetical protein